MNIKNLHDDGFTLIETLVAATIFSFAVLGLGVGTVSVARTNNVSHLIASSVNLAQAKLEDFRAMTSTAFAALSCPTYATTGCKDFPVASGKTFTRSWQFTANSPAVGVNKVEVKIEWTDYTMHSSVFTASVPQ